MNQSVGAVHKLGVKVGSPQAAQIHAFSGDRFPAAPLVFTTAKPTPLKRPTFRPTFQKEPRG